ncbi:hypothetical protein A0J61_07067 [Choanephora cucurbitarum]|uniref:Myb-like domain-containing protein n=1 Tax=Choanephora cucurbitarum TaxID=101091 RepID=A0A1C7N7D6_9FUNG|nr:hypothetical protein A0J61_07067 [Choanephora cucurbitarum]
MVEKKARRRKMRPNNVIAIERANTERIYEEKKKQICQHKLPPKKKKQQMAVESASDSDETDHETEKNRGASEADSSEADNNEADTQADNDTKNKKRVREDSEEEGQKKQKITDSAKKSILDANRISFRRRIDADPAKPVSVNYKNKLLDTFVPDVKADDFISASDSEEDSGDDYESKDYPAWQRTLGWNPEPDTAPWPKQRKLGYSDKLKLEKRIKKVCKRENMTFAEAREIFSSSNRKPHIRFFQKIAKVFPNISLHMLAKVCKETYHEKRNNSPWQPEEIELLQELLKVHGPNTSILCQHLNRSPKNITDCLFSLRNVSKNNKRWSKEEDEKLAKIIAEGKQKTGERPTFPSIVPMFNGERTQKQIYQRYHHIQHRIMPDGTLLPDRKPTAQEELEYLEKLMEQVREHDLVEESQLDLSKEKGFVKRSFYLRSRAQIPGFETMKVKGKDHIGL